MRSTFLLLIATASTLACSDRVLGLEGETGVADTDTSATSQPDTDTETGAEGPTCGDGVVDPGEQCDFGSLNDDSSQCTTHCQIAACGDGLVFPGLEECDDGPGNADTHACTLNCRTAECGDGKVFEGHEECDDENYSSFDDCTSACEQAECGDGYIHENVEVCDDGNDVDGDLCSNDCTSNLDPACEQPHASLNDETRDILFNNDGPGGLQHCDRLDAPSKSPDWNGPGWYTTGTWTHMNFQPVQDYDCGTTSGGWVTTNPPSLEDGVVSREICFASGGNPCAWSVEAMAVACVDFQRENASFVLWYLPDVPTCDLRYCTWTPDPP